MLGAGKGCLLCARARVLAIEKDGLSALARSCMCKKHRVRALVSHIRSHEIFIILSFFQVA